jgi:hypothetical protein
MTRTPQAVRPFFGGFVLETLTIGMYGESRNAIREYIQNGFDSIEHAIESGTLRPGEGHIEVVMAESRDALTIRDNGSGLSTREATATLTQIGASTKDFRSNAGFRGIGRLAGIVFSNAVTFTTKERGETEKTTVVFDSRRMRDLMTPSKGSTMAAEDVIRECVTAYVEPSGNREEHFFEVHLEGFVDPPAECQEYLLLRDFIAQVGPVRYPAEFPFHAQLRATATQCKLPIEEVRITLQDGANAPIEVTKLYGAEYETPEGRVALLDCETRIGADNAWWCWYGKKGVSGAYTDGRVSGLRVRMKNIQIDGTDVVREIFSQQARSYIRFQDWVVGEIFVRPSAVVPNARRDGFEDTVAWKRIRRELGTVVKDIGKESYELSNQGQLGISALESKVEEKREVLKSLQRSNFQNVNRALEVSVDITKLQKRIAAASKDADLETLAALQALGSDLSDTKAVIISRIGQLHPPVNADAIRQETRDELLQELIESLRGEVPSPCFVAVRNFLQENYGLGTIR